AICSSTLDTPAIHGRRRSMRWGVQGRARFDASLMPPRGRRGCGPSWEVGDVQRGGRHRNASVARPTRAIRWAGGVHVTVRVVNLHAWPSPHPSPAGGRGGKGGPRHDMDAFIRSALPLPVSDRGIVAGPPPAHRPPPTLLPFTGEGGAQRW